MSDDVRGRVERLRVHVDDLRLMMPDRHAYPEQWSLVETLRGDADRILALLDREGEPRYPCDHPGCEVMRTKAEGGTVFSVCEEHWAEHWKKTEPAPGVEPGETEALREALKNLTECYDFLRDEIGFCLDDEIEAMREAVARALTTQRGDR